MAKTREQLPPNWREGQLCYQSGMNLEMAQKMLDAAEKEAKNQKVPVSMAIADTGGNLIAFRRMDNSILMSVQISINKAVTANFSKLPTLVWADVFRGGGLPVLQFHENLITLPGGFPIIKEGKIYGGLGISGGVAKHDISVARAALKAGGFSTADTDAALEQWECE